jgi:quinoprotein glucose dehydrogenase
MESVRRLNISENMGLPSRNWTLVTRTVMIVVQLGYYSPPRFVPGLNLPVRDLHNRDPHLWVYDKTSGEMLAEMELPANATGAPMTYMAGGKQFIVFSVGGGPLVEELVAVSL